MRAGKGFAQGLWMVMSKKKKTSAKQTKPKTQKPAAKPAKETAAPKRDVAEPKKEASKPAATQVSQAKEKKPDQADSKQSISEASSKGKPEAASKSVSSKQEPAQAKVDSKPASPPPSEAKKVEAAKSTAKGQTSGKRKKDKTPRQSAESQDDELAAVAEPQEEPVLSPTGDVSEEAKRESVIDEPAANTPVSAPLEANSISNVEAEAPFPAGEAKRKVAKTLIDEDVNFSPNLDVPSDSVEKKAAEATNTKPESNVGALHEAASKATGTAPNAQEPPRKVARTLMDFDSAGLRDAVEASARAIEEEIAAAIKESEVDSAAPPSVAPKAPVPKPADRKIAKTMLDFKAEEFFELADFATGTEEEAAEQSPHPGQSATDPSVSTPAAESVSPPPQQPRKVAKTMLEVDVSNINAVVEAANAKEQEPPRDFSAGYDDVSMDDLNEFAQALRDNTAMSPPGSRAERLRKTMLGIRKHGLVSSPSMPGVSLPSENTAPEVPASTAPVRVSRSLHPLDNFSFDNLCPADEDASSVSQDQSMAPDHDVLADSAPSGDTAVSADWRSAGDQGAEVKKKTGTVELSQSPHSQADGDFKGVTTVWPHDQEKQEQQEQPTEAKQGSIKPERFIPKTMLDMDFLKESLSASVSRAEERLAESIAQKASEPPKQVLTADDYKMVSPNCPFVWADNPDNPKERVKYCTECSAQIYNFTGFDMTESQSLIFKRENRQNAPLYKREDGKFMTNDCPIALKKKKDKQMLIGGAALVLVLLVIMVVASFMAPQPPAPSAPSAADSSSTSSDSTSSSTTTGSAVSVPDSKEPGAGKNGNAEAPGTFHYKKGKVTQSPTQSPGTVPPVTVPDENPTIPGTTSGYDEGGQFWQYTDKGNN